MKIALDEQELLSFVKDEILIGMSWKEVLADYDEAAGTDVIVVVSEDDKETSLPFSTIYEALNVKYDTSFEKHDVTEINLNGEDAVHFVFFT